MFLRENFPKTVNKNSQISCFCGIYKRVSPISFNIKEIPLINKPHVVKVFSLFLKQLNIATMHFLLGKYNHEFGNQIIEIHCFPRENKTYTGTVKFAVESLKSKATAGISTTENPRRKRSIIVMENIFCRKVQYSKHQRNGF